MHLTARATEAPEPYVVPPSDKFDGPDGSWSTFRISVGTPGQDLRVLPSTKGGVIYVVPPEGCLEGVDPPDCPQRRGIEVFRSAQSTGFQVNASTTWSAIGQYDVDLEDALNYTGKGLFGFDTVTLGAAADSSSSASLTRQVVAAVADTDYYLGILGLGQAKSSFNSGSQPIDSFLYLLRESKRIPSFAYAYTAGAKYRLKSAFGSLVLGGYDATRFETNTNDFSFTFSQDPSRLLTVGVASIMATNILQGTYSMTSGEHLSVIDSTVPHLWLPADVCAEFEAAFGLTYDPQTDLYLVNDTIHEELLSKKPTLTFKLVGSLQDATTNYTNIELPYAAFDLQASYPYYANATNYFPIRRAANDSQYVLGRTLLQEAYLMVDYERANFTVAQAVFPDPLSASNIITIRSPSDSESTQASTSSSGIGTGAIVGIVIGVVATLILVITGVFFFWKRRGKDQKEQRYELTSRPILEVDSGAIVFAGNQPSKALSPQELHGTPLTELASPVNDQLTGHEYPQDQKTVIDMTDEPQELHGESIMPVTRGWREVQPPHPPFQHEMDAESSTSHSVSGVPSEDGYATSERTLRSGVSPVSPQLPRHKYG